MRVEVPGLLRIKENALHKLGKYLRQEGWTEVALVFSAGVKELVWPVLEISLASSEVTVVQEHSPGSNAVEEGFALATRMAGKVQAVVAVGGGLAQDLGKYAAFLNHLPFVAVPTIISNDGFASPFSSLLVEGRRRTVRSCTPDAVILDTRVIATAPARYFYAGIGDIAAKYTAVADWKLAFKKSGEKVNDFAAVVAEMAADSVLHHPAPGLDNPDFVGTVAEALLMCGISMELAGSSRPASGGEHLISHAYDQLAAKPALHGIQVGVASYLSAWIQTGCPDMNAPLPLPLARQISFLERTGFLAFAATSPLDRATFLAALAKAPAVKDKFHTIIHEPGMVERAAAFISSDPRMQTLLV